MQINKHAARRDRLGQTNFAAVFLILALSACQDEPAAPTAAAPVVKGAERTDDSLMTAVFGERYRPRSKDAMVPIYDPMFESKHLFRVRAVSSTVLAAGDIVLLTRGSRVDRHDGASEEPGEYFYMHAYFLRRVQDKWTVIARQENVAPLGIAEGVGGVAWIGLGNGREGLAVRDGTRWGKCALEYLSLFEVADQRLRPVADRIPSKSLSKGMCVRDRRYSHWNVETTWRMEPPKQASPYHDLVMEMFGDDASPPNIVDVDAEPTGPLVETKVKGAARYAYDAKLKQYTLVEGDNLVPTNQNDYD